jgi:hypothetical protein
MGHGMKCKLEQYMVLGGGARRPGEHLTQTELSNISEEVGGQAPDRASR